jgi:hypothetical protein
MEGERVLIISHDGKRYTLSFPDTLTVPATVGRYRIVNLGRGMVKVVKALIRL